MATWGPKEPGLSCGQKPLVLGGLVGGDTFFLARADTQLAGFFLSLAFFPSPALSILLASELLVPSPPLPSFQLFLVTIDPWPWTDQTSTRNKSLFQVDGVLFPAQALQVRCCHGECWLCLPRVPSHGAGRGGEEPSVSPQAHVASKPRLLCQLRHGTSCQSSLNLSFLI